VFDTVRPIALAFKNVGLFSIAEVIYKVEDNILWSVSERVGLHLDI